MAGDVVGTVVAGVVPAVVVGALGGALLRRGLRRLRRGADARRGVCETGVALAVGAPVAAAALGVASPTWVPVWIGVGVVAVAVGVTDLAHRRIPDALTGAGLVALVLLVVPLGPAAVASGLGGAALGVVVHAGARLASPGSLGGGDVKLAGVLGVPLAAGSWVAFALAPALTAVAVLVVAAVTRTRTVALGPLAAGVAWVLVAGLAAGGGGPRGTMVACCGG